MKAFVVTTFSIFILFLLLIPTEPVKAVAEKTIGGSMVATINPKSPGPNEQVTINLLGYGYDINQSTIIWILNGQQVKKEIGGKSFSFTTGQIGDLSVIGVLLTTKEGKKIVKQITITPGLVNLVWEADTYTPEFYRGASLPTSGSKITVEAIPQITYNGKIIPAKDLVFNWKKDYKNLINESGLGKSSIQFLAGIYPNSHNIEVVVEYPKLADSFYNKIIIPISVPKIIVYPFTPLAGVIKNKPINDNFTPTKEEESFKAEGYFFPTQDIQDGLVNFSWTINDKSVTISNSDNSILNTKTDTDTQGKVRINVFASDILNKFTEARLEFNILLNKSFFNF